MASEPVFADASFFFALAAKRDAAHGSAVSVFAALLRKQRSIVTTDYVVAEALTLTKARTNAEVALALLDRIERSEAIGLETVSGARFELAKAFFRKHADHDYSFTDCTSFVIMRELEITDALTTDRHFAEAGYRPLLAVT
ncbi:MAG: type II toxin-antitoxin system VapC family toxin [Verrucomicrobiales bacterium]